MSNYKIGKIETATHNDKRVSEFIFPNCLEDEISKWQMAALTAL